VASKDTIPAVLTLLNFTSSQGKDFPHTENQTEEGLVSVSTTASFVEPPASNSPIGGITSPQGSGPTSLVRKCLGKNKSTDCLQGVEHNNTRWECSFETQNKDEFLKHCKNIAKRVKWRDLILAVENAKTEKDGWYRCVYFSTDRHHVENHYQKGSADMALSPSPNQVARYKNYMQQRGYSKRSKRDMDDSDDGDDNLSPEDTAREMKKLKQDASLLGFFQEQHMELNGEGKEATHLPDNLKIVELVGTVEKKLEIDHQIAEEAVEKLHKQGFFIVAGLKTLRKEGWEKLNLPAAIEEELKNQINSSRNFAPWYGMGVPFYFPHQGGFWSGQYNSMGQPIYVPYPPQYENQDAVLGMGEVASGDKEKEKAEEKENVTPESMEHLESAAVETPQVPLVPPKRNQADASESKA